MPGDISRRVFLKSGLATACGIAASQIPGRAFAVNNDQPLATLLDIRKCIGCEACVEAYTDRKSVV